ncbi:hypothetical protein HIM_00466 [Hirsutella minnesotensis 3608]|nr:hypothetical protein HIM_00466 [Hirsutella minnesotensis 3608]
MDALRLKVDAIHDTLSSSNRELQNLNRNSEKDICREMGYLVAAIELGDQNISHVFQELGEGLRQVPRDQVAKLDLAPQLEWLGVHLTRIWDDFKRAASSTQSAMAQAMVYSYKANDIQQLASAKAVELAKLETEAHRLSEMTREKLDRSLGQLDEKLKEASVANNDLKENEKHYDQLLKAKEKTEAELRGKRAQIDDAEKQIESERDDRAVGLVIAGVSLGATILSGGLLLPLAAPVVGGSAAYSIVSQRNVRKLKKTLHQIESRLAGVQADVANREQVLGQLRERKFILQDAVAERKMAIKELRGEQERYVAEMSRHGEVRSRINLLTDQIASTACNVRNMQADLRLVKEKLEVCTLTLESASFEMTQPFYVPFAEDKEKQRAGQTKRQIQTIQAVISNLGKIHGQLPSLLEANRDRNHFEYGFRQFGKQQGGTDLGRIPHMRYWNAKADAASSQAMAHCDVSGASGGDAAPRMPGGFPD